MKALIIFLIFLVSFFVGIASFEKDKKEQSIEQQIHEQYQDSVLVLTDTLYLSNEQDIETQKIIKEYTEEKRKEKESNEFWGYLTLGLIIFAFLFILTTS